MPKFQTLFAGGLIWPMSGLDFAMGGRLETPCYTDYEMRALVVDDEPLARRVLRQELGTMPDLEVVGEAENGMQALERIRSLQPDLVFLDLQMPGLSGFDVIEEMEPAGPPPSVVIVTAFDKHAIQAFDAGAVDYLLKPVRMERLAQCVERIRALRASASAVADQAARLRNIVHNAASERPWKVVGKLGAEFHLLDCEQVLAFQSERELVWIFTKGQRYLATKTLGQIEGKLAGCHFARVHRNSLVNLDHVAKMAPLSSQRWLLTLKNGPEFVVSKRQAGKIQNLLIW